MTAESVHVSDFVGLHLRDLRRRGGWSSVKSFAERCAEVGAPHLTEPVISDIESRRVRPHQGNPRRVTVDDVENLARALDVPVLELLPPSWFEASVTTTTYHFPTAARSAG